MWQEAEFLDRTYYVSGSGDLKAFVDMARQDMMGGTVAQTLDVERWEDDWSRTYTVSTEVTILSPQTASIVLDVDHVYEVDLATGDVTGL